MKKHLTISHKVAVTSKYWWWRRFLLQLWWYYADMNYTDHDRVRDAGRNMAIWKKITSVCSSKIKVMPCKYSQQCNFGSSIGDMMLQFVISSIIVVHLHSGRRRHWVIMFNFYGRSTRCDDCSQLSNVQQCTNCTITRVYKLTNVNCCNWLAHLHF